MSSVPASAGIPVTHRGVSAQVTLVSGHSASGEDLDFHHLAKTPGTLGRLHGPRPPRGDRVPPRRRREGRPHPAAVVSRGTNADGESVTGELHEIAQLAAGLESPALLVVGDVVAIGSHLASVAGHYLTAT